MTYQQQAARNVALKKQYPNIDDPVRAINFALDGLCFGDAAAFLLVWREGYWYEIERDWPEYFLAVKT